MNNQTKLMLVATFFIFTLLVVKSLWVDPISGLEGQALEYYNFVENAIHEEYKGMANPPITTMKVVKIYHDPAGEDTIILQRNSGNPDWDEYKLEGKYGARIRFYFLHILPYKQFKVQGGIENVR